VSAAGMVAAAGGAGAKVQIIATEGGDAEDDQATGFANVTGGSGNDTLTGDTGNNVLEGGKGADTLTGGGGFDIVSYASSTGAVTVDLSNNSASGGDAQSDTIFGFDGVFGGFGNDQLTGNANNNVLSGRAGNDMLSGGLGKDTLSGGDGNDSIEGGADADTLDGGLGIDTLSYANSPAGLNNAGVVIDLSKKTATGNDAAGDKISNFENITGSTGNDTLTGDKSSNVIMGGAGNDTITGGAGIDTLTGGVGDDVFRFLAPADGGDDITDFNSSGVDKISIVKSAFGMAAANLANFTSSQYFEQGVGHAPTAKHAQFLFDTSTDELWFDSDGIGTKAAVLIATFTDGATLDASDFELK
jgi:Ca2+-binding RTX toxin-like protein